MGTFHEQALSFLDVFHTHFPGAVFHMLGVSVRSQVTALEYVLSYPYSWKFCLQELFQQSSLYSMQRVVFHFLLCVLRLYNYGGTCQTEHNMLARVGLATVSICSELLLGCRYCT